MTEKNAQGVQYNNYSPSQTPALNVDERKQVTITAANIALGIAAGSPTTTLDGILAHATYGVGVTGTVAGDFGRILVTGTANGNTALTHTLADGTNVGDVFEIVLASTLAGTGGGITLTCGDKLRNQIGGSTVTLTSADDGCKLVWDGYKWVVIYLNGTSTTTVTLATTPGAAVPITHSVVTMTIVANSIGTVANGTPGQILHLYVGTDTSGDATITPATATGFTSVVLTSALESCTLKYIDDTTGWIIIGQAPITGSLVYVA